MMGASNWRVEGNAARLPWNPKCNGLKYLYDYNLTTANHMLTASDWTRAIFVREPKEQDYGTVAVFEDLYGNLWDLLELDPSHPMAGR